MSKQQQENWDGLAYLAILDTANDLPTFTTDDVWERLDQNNPSDNRRLGVVMRRAFEDGLVTPTFAFKRTTRRCAHGRPVRVWKTATL